MPRYVLLSIIWAGVMSSSPALAQSFHFTLSPASSISTAVEVSVPLDGFLIGDYDAVSNPSGTRTLPGVFGGSGNNEIPVTIDFEAAGEDTTTPGGSFDIDVDGLDFGVRNLAIDTLSGQPLAIDLTANLLYQTFRTVAPNSLFPGGFTVPLPLGQMSVTSFTFTQAGAGAGQLTPTATPDEFTFTMLVPATADIEIDVLGQTQTAPGVPIVFALSGDITLPASGNASLSASNEIETETPLPAPPTGLEAVPFDVPTVLPTGSTAHLLLTADILEGSAATAVASSIEATGEPICRADLTGDGVLDFFDFLEFQNLFTAGDPGADFNNDGVLDFFDFLAFQNAFTAGC